MDTFPESEDVRNDVEHFFRSRLAYQTRIRALSQSEALSSACSTSVSKHQFDLLRYFGQNVAKFKLQSLSESVAIEERGGYLFSVQEEKQTTFPPIQKPRLPQDS